jgi:sugar lactone lactonase YvrE
MDVTEVYGFSWLNFTFGNTEEYQAYYDNETYTNCLLAGIKVSKNGTYFVSVPRWNSGVPATLNTIVEVDGLTLLQPFPSWEDNKVNNSKTLQSVLGFEIDKDDRVWVLDQGRVNGVPVAGSTKVVAYNMDGSVYRYIDLSSVADPATSFLNDLVYDTVNNFLYIADSGIPADGGAVKGSLIIVNLDKDSGQEPRKVLYNTVYTNPDPGLWININGALVNTDGPMSTGADGIALSCEGDLLFWTSLTSRTMYAIETKYLRKTEDDLEDKIIYMGYKLSASDGLALTAKGDLYITALEQSAIYRLKDVNLNANSFDYLKFDTVVQNSTTMVWPDTIGFNNHKKTMVFVSNQLQRFENRSLTWNTTNFRIWEVDVDDYSYLYGCDADDDEDDSSNFPSWVWPVVVVISLIIAAMLTLFCYKKLKKRRRYSMLGDIEASPATNS